MTALVARDADVGVSDLDGWDLDDVRAALDHAVDHAAHFRSVTGLLLWKLRTLLPDGDYGGEVQRLADRLELTTATLGRWRNQAETACGLGAPDDRTAGARRKAATRAMRPESRGARESGLIERVTPDEVMPPAEQLALPGAEAWGVVAAMTIDVIHSGQRDTYLTIHTAGFQTNRWRFYDGQALLWATIRDDTFIAQLNAGQRRVGPLDVLNCRISEQQWRDTSGFHREVEVLVVLDVLPYEPGEQGTLALDESNNPPELGPGS